MEPTQPQSPQNYDPHREQNNNPPPAPHLQTPSIESQGLANPQPAYPQYDPQMPTHPPYSQPIQPASPAHQPYPEAPVNPEDQKDFVVAFLLSWLLGGLGADRFYLGYTGLGIFKLLTLGGLGIWALIDTVLLAFGKLKDRAGPPLRGYKQNKTWVRILAVIHVIFVGLILLVLVVTVVSSIGNRSNITADLNAGKTMRDTERRNDIQAIQAALAQYNNEKGYYPMGLNELSGLSDAVCADPSDKAASCKFPSYSYIPYSSIGTNTGCNNTSAKCLAYALESNNMETNNGNPQYKVTSN